MGCRPQGSPEGSGLTIYRHNVPAAGARGFSYGPKQVWMRAEHENKLTELVERE
jgi:hypothetical protein